MYLSWTDDVPIVYPPYTCATGNVQDERLTLMLQRPYGSSRTRSRSCRSAPYAHVIPFRTPGLSDVLTPRRQGVFLRLYSSTAGASRTASLAFCSSESGGARWASLRRYSSRRCLYLSSRCCPASVISRLAIRSPALGRSRPAGSSTKKQTRIPRSRCTSCRTGAVLRRRAGRRRTAASARHPSACAPRRSTFGIASGPAPALRHSSVAWRASGSCSSPSDASSMTPHTSASRSARPPASARSAATAAACSSAVSSRHVA